MVKLYYKKSYHKNKYLYSNLLNLFMLDKCRILFLFLLTKYHIILITSFHIIFLYFRYNNSNHCQLKNKHYNHNILSKIYFFLYYFYMF